MNLVLSITINIVNKCLTKEPYSQKAHKIRTILILIENHQGGS